jgi:hypothetical protein
VVLLLTLEGVRLFVWSVLAIYTVLRLAGWRKAVVFLVAKKTVLW